MNSQKMRFLGIVVLSLLLLGVLGTATEKISTNFETGTKEGWTRRKVKGKGTTRGIGTWKVVKSSKLRGDYLLRLDTTGGNANSNIAINKQFLVNMTDNFTLTFDYYLPESNNRGPFIIACKEEAYSDSPIDQSDLSTIFRIKHNPARGGPRVEQIDKYEDQSKFNVSRPSFQQQHRVKILKKGDTLKSYIDGKQVATTTMPLSGKWFICLSGSGGWGSTRTIYFDNVQVFGAISSPEGAINVHPPFKLEKHGFDTGLFRKEKGQRINDFQEGHIRSKIKFRTNIVNYYDIGVGENILHIYKTKSMQVNNTYCPIFNLNMTLDLLLRRHQVPEVGFGGARGAVLVAAYIKNLNTGEILAIKKPVLIIASTPKPKEADRNYVINKFLTLLGYTKLKGIELPLKAALTAYEWLTGKWKIKVNKSIKEIQFPPIQLKAGEQYKFGLLVENGAFIGGSLIGGASAMIDLSGTFKNITLRTCK